MTARELEMVGLFRVLPSHIQDELLLKAHLQIRREYLRPRIKYGRVYLPTATDRLDSNVECNLYFFDGYEWELEARGLLIPSTQLKSMDLLDSRNGFSVLLLFNTQLTQLDPVGNEEYFPRIYKGHLALLKDKVRIGNTVEIAHYELLLKNGDHVEVSPEVFASLKRFKK